MSLLARVFLVLVVAAPAVAACGDDDGGDVRSGSSASSGSAASAASSGSAASGASGAAEEAKCEPVGDPADADAEVATSLSEFEIDLAPAEVSAGTIAFEGANEGAEPHEFVIAEAEDAAALPTDADGAVDESKMADGALIGEVEPFPADSTCDGVFALEAGDYVVFCNIVEEEEDGTMESHFAEGMHSTLTVR